MIRLSLLITVGILMAALLFCVDFGLFDPLGLLPSLYVVSLRNKGL